MSESDDEALRGDDSSFREFLHNLGPFEPPDDYAFEPELRDPPPRTIPGELNQGRHARRRRKTLVGGLMSGFLCVGLGLLPVVQFAGLFVLPLAYLSWIGVGIVAITVVSYLRNLSRKGPFEYVVNGNPLVARICSLAMLPKTRVHGEAVTYEFASIIQYRDPETYEVVLAETVSNEFGAMYKDGLTTSYRAGDYATAVYLDSDFEATPRLYGFLDLRPGLGVIKRDSTSSDSPFNTALSVLAFFAFFWATFWDVYALNRYSPLEWTFGRVAWPMAIGGGIIGGLILWMLTRHAANRHRRTDDANSLAIAEGLPVELGVGPRGWFASYGIGAGIIIALCVLLFGGFTMLCWTLTVNAELDTSPPRPRPVMITDMVMTTHRGVLRDYKIEYKFPRGKKSHSLLSTPEHMAQFASNLGMAQLRSGWLGWEWVETIKPIAVPAPAGQ